MPAQKVCTRKASRSQRTQATVSASNRGTQCLLRFTSSAGSQTDVAAPTDVQVGASTQYDAPLEPVSSLGGVDSSLAWGPGREEPRDGSSFAHGAGKTTGNSATTQVEGLLCAGHESTLPTADAPAVVWPYTCSACQATFLWLADLRGHVRAHSSVQCFRCALCQESFGTPLGLAEHERWHACGEPCSCSLCPKVFMDKGKMVRHQREHAGEKPHVCGVCGKGFEWRSYRVSHERTHSGERPYVCGVCGNGFTRRRHLTSHEKLHCREMPPAVVSGKTAHR